MDSRSLREFVNGKKSATRECALSGLGSWRMAMDGRYKYVRGFEKSPAMLFDMKNDPAENDNIAASEPKIAGRLAKFLV